MPRPVPTILTLFLLLFPAPWPRGAVSGPGSVQTAPAPKEGGAGGVSAPSSPEKRRPEACLHPERLGPIRVQVGTNKMFVKVGHTIQIPVRVKGVCDLAAFHFGLAFNPRVARLVRVEQTPFLAGDPPVEIAFQGLRPGAGQQTIMGARPPGTGTVDGIGTLARLVFVGWTTGMTTIRLTRLHLQDGERREFRSFQVPVDLFVRPDHAPAGRR